MNQPLQELIHLLAAAVIEQLIAEQSEGKSKTEPADNFKPLLCSSSEERNK